MAWSEKEKQRPPVNDLPNKIAWVVGIWKLIAEVVDEALWKNV